MSSAPAAVAVAVAAAASLGAAQPLASAYRTGPPPAHTGAFGEPDCAACHLDAVREDPAGSVELVAPSAYRPGERYDLVLTVRHPQLEAAGFQLAVRFTDDPRAGVQAGVLEPVEPRTRTEVGEDGVVYASHTDPGTAPVEEGVGRWTVRWTAPAAPGGPVAIDAAVNAANYDDSELGDRVYLVRRSVSGPPP